MAKYKDADELLKRLNACKYPAEKTTNRQASYNTAISDACRIVDAIPAADVAELRCGKWEKGKCSVCGFDWHNIQYEKTKVNKSPYCPNCGAKMRK